MEKSLKQIIYETNVLVDAHVQLRSFYYGDLLDIIKIGAIDYATCFYQLIVHRIMLILKHLI